MPVFQLKRNLELRTSLEEAWDFISSPKNLERITPNELGFEITSEVPEKMYEGMIITYNVSPFLGIKTTWVTEITHIKEQAFFVDEQRVGPYRLWHHQHWLEATEEGVRMKDIVTYQPPFGFLGLAMNALVIQKKLNHIFNYREKILEELFS